MVGLDVVGPLVLKLNFLDDSCLLVVYDWLLDLLYEVRNDLLDLEDIFSDEQGDQEDEGVRNDLLGVLSVELLVERRSVWRRTQKKVLQFEA